MTRAKTTKLYRTFVKGLITEAGFLTYPDDASTDELNTVLSRKGNRTRRLGIDYEDNTVIRDVNWSSTYNDIVAEFVWSNANNEPDQNFLVVQIGYKLHFFVMDGNPVSDNKAPFILSLYDYRVPGTSNWRIRKQAAQFASGAGFLFVCHPYVEPLNIEYDKDTNTLQVTSMIIQVRDLDGVDDGLANDQEPPTLNKLHHYNLLNQGWGNNGTSYYYSPYAGNDAPTSGETEGTSSTPSSGGSGTYDRDGSFIIDEVAV